MPSDWIDISQVTGDGTAEWPGDTPFSCGWTARIAQGSSVNLSSITMSPHVGTHADAPLHVRDGWSASDALPLDAFSGEAWVCSAPSDRDWIELSDLRGLPAEGRIERLLVRTSRTIDGGFPNRWPSLRVGAVHALLSRGLVLLGVDAPSVDARESKTLEVHHALFANRAFNLENLRLDGVADGRYELFAFPLRVSGIDAAPVRAVLRALLRAESA